MKKKKKKKKKEKENLGVQSSLHVGRVSTTATLSRNCSPRYCKTRQ